jgi:hypothetical protein
VTYLKRGTEYLTADEAKVYESVLYLSGSGRTGNNSQIAADTGLSRTAVGHLTRYLSARRFIRDVSKGAAYHWRATDKPVAVEPGVETGPFLAERLREQVAK